MTDPPEPHTSRFLVWLYTPPSRRPLFAALCRIEREIASSLRPGVDHHVAHTRLQWWREECARCRAGNPVHPLTRELLAQLRELAPEARRHAALEGLSGWVDAATWDLAAATFTTRDELTSYCRRWAAAMVEPLSDAGTASAVPGVAPEALSSRLGPALREIELLCDLARDARHGRLRVPLDELDQAGIPPEALGAPPWPQGLSALLCKRHLALREELAAAAAGLPHESQRRIPGLLVWAALAWHASRRAERALPSPPAFPAATGMGANWRAWRAARAALAGRFRLM